MSEFKRTPDTSEALRTRFSVLQQRCHDAKKANLVRKAEALEEAANALLHLLSQSMTEIVDLRRDVDYLKQQHHVLLSQKGKI